MQKHKPALQFKLNAQKSQGGILIFREAAVPTAVPVAVFGELQLSLTVNEFNELQARVLPPPPTTATTPQ